MKTVVNPMQSFLKENEQYTNVHEVDNNEEIQGKVVRQNVGAVVCEVDGQRFIQIADNGDCLSDIPSDSIDGFFKYRCPETNQPVTEHDGHITLRMLEKDASYRNGQMPLSRRKLDFYELCHSLKQRKPEEYPSYYPGKKIITLKKYERMARKIPRHNLSPETNAQTQELFQLLCKAELDVYITRNGKIKSGLGDWYPIEEQVKKYELDYDEQMKKCLEKVAEKNAVLSEYYQPELDELRAEFGDIKVAEARKIKSNGESKIKPNLQQRFLVDQVPDEWPNGCLITCSLCQKGYKKFYLADVKALDWKFQPVKKLPQEVAEEVHGELKPNVLPVYKEPESKERISKYPNAIEEMDKILDSLDHPYRLRAVKKEAENQIAEIKKTWSNKDDKILTAMENDRINKETFFPKRFEVVGGKRYLGWKGENETNDKRLIEEEKFVAVSEIPADFRYKEETRALAKQKRGFFISNKAMEKAPLFKKWVSEKTEQTPYK